MIDLTIIGTFILDFQTVDFEPDSKIAVDLLSSWQKTSQMENAFALDPPVQSAGWSFAKVFLAGQFVEKIYAIYAHDVDASKGKKFEDKFVAWLQKELKNSGCGAQIKMAPEMKSI
ncbi:MAG TPA: hypothetical protein VGQ13_04475 [Nitrososphaera sp.]|jgi:hypothetical protein|nr:hypothetical protein [Nitrososphaera sp.]